MTAHTTLMPNIAWAQASARRLERNGLTARLPDARPADAAEVMMDVHAQVISASVHSIGIRVSGVTQGDIQRALWEEHSLIKTYGPRGTVHLLSAQHLPMWMGALSATPYGQTRDPGQDLLTTARPKCSLSPLETFSWKWS